MKTLYVHIGTPKTGTTSIQHFLYANREILESRGYCYPEFPFKYRNRGKYRNGLFLEAVCYDEYGGRLVELEDERFYAGLEMIRLFFKTYENIILSDEGIWNACFVKKRGKNLLPRLKEAADRDGYQVKIIVYLRNQADYLLSWYNQIIKHNITPHNTDAWEKYKKKYNRYISLDYYECIKKIEEIFGRENIIVRRFDAKFLKNGSLYADFLNIFGFAADDGFCVEEDEEDLNARLSENACEIKRVVNSVVGENVEANRWFERVLRDVSNLSDAEGIYSMMSSEEIDEFMGAFESSNNKLKKEYFTNEDSLFSGRNEKIEKWKKDNPYMLDDVIRFSCVSTAYVIDMVKDMMMEQKNQIKQADKTVRRGVLKTIKVRLSTRHTHNNRRK